MSGFYQYDTRGASPASQIITLERLLLEATERAERADAENERLRALLWEARAVVLPAWASPSPKPAHLAITPERQALADRIDAALSARTEGEG